MSDEGLLTERRVTLDRLLSKLGVASRQRAQVLIREGRVCVDQQVVHSPERWVAWPTQTVLLDGQPICPPASRVILLHKPRGLLTTHQDERGRPTIFDVLPAEFRTLHMVGRLDQATSGLLLLTNDTYLSSFLTDPANAIPRVYLVTVRGKVTDAVAQQAVQGIQDAHEHLRCDQIRIQKQSNRESHLEVTLTEGKNREIRRLFRALGHDVTRLRRIRFGPFALGELAPGAWKESTAEEARQKVGGKGTALPTASKPSKMAKQEGNQEGDQGML